MRAGQQNIRNMAMGKLATVFVVMLLSVTSRDAVAKTAIDDAGRWFFSGDVRLRTEVDWDSQKADGTYRDDRTRARIRLRMQLEHRYSDELSFAVRARTGAHNAQQSGNYTVVDFDGNPRGKLNINLDKWVAKYEGNIGDGAGFKAYLGRDDLHYWKQTKVFWDSDMTQAGLAVVATRRLSEKASMTFNGGHFALPVGLREWSGALTMGQLVYDTECHGIGLTLAGGVFDVNSDGSDKDASRLLNGNGARDYTTWVANSQLRFSTPIAPLRFGVDYYYNSQNYSSNDADSFTAANHGRTKAYIISTQLGKLKKKGDWLFRYMYADVDELAFSSSYADDSMARWGKNGQADVTGFTGHEFRLAYQVTDKFQTVARFYTVEADESVEDGHRFRLDMKYKF